MATEKEFEEYCDKSSMLWKNGYAHGFRDGMCRIVIFLGIIALILYFL